MSDVRARLNAWANTLVDGSEQRILLREAVTEIDHLRGLAGAVSAGPELAKIRSDLRPVSSTTGWVEMPVILTGIPGPDDGLSADG